MDPEHEWVNLRLAADGTPLLFGLLMDEMGIEVLAISAGLSLSALFALLLLKARPAAAPCAGLARLQAEPLAGCGKSRSIRPDLG